MGGSRSHLDKKKKLENRPKTKFCVCTIRSLLTACIVNAIVLHKQRSRKSTKPAMCVWRLSLAHTIWPNTNKKQDTRGNRQYGRVCLLTLRYSHIQMMDSILICRLIIDKSTSICTWYNVLVFCLDCMMWYACKQHFIPYSVILWWGPFKCYVTQMGVGGCLIFWKKALRRCNVQCY